MKRNRNDNIVRRVRLNRRPTISGRAVKSTIRTLQIVEILDSLRRGVNCTSIASMIQAPVSSTDYILRTMASLGYIEYDREDRIYSLGHRLAPLGSWLNPALVREGPVISVMKAVCEYVGENVILVTRNGLFSQVIHIVQPDGADKPLVTVGTSVDIFRSPAGHCLLSLLSNEYIKTLIKSYNAKCGSGDDIVRVRPFLEAIDRIRKDGYEFSGNSKIGWGLALPLPEFSGSQIFAIVVGAFDSKINVDPEVVRDHTARAIKRYQDD